MALASAPQTRSSKLQLLFVGLLHLQNMVLLAYLFWAMFDPNDAGLITGLVFLPILWLFALVLGVWCWWRARDASTLRLALWGCCAAPLMLAIQSALLQADMLPIAEGVQAQTILVFGLFTYPSLLLCWLLFKVTTRAKNENQTLKSTPLARIVVFLSLMLAVLAILMTCSLLLEIELLGDGSFESWLENIPWITLAFSSFAVPYALLNMFRRSQPMSASLLTLLSVSISGFCYVFMVGYIGFHVVT